MSVTCEPIGSDSDEVSQAVSRPRSNEKDAYEEEELDYEEEMEYSKSMNNVKNEEEGELSDDDDTTAQASVPSKSKDKDEGELDEDEDLEEGEVKEEEEEEGAAVDVQSRQVELERNGRNRNSNSISQQDHRNSSRHDNTQRHGNSYYNSNNSNSYHYQNYNNNSRYNNRSSDRYSNSRNREYNPPPHAPPTLASAASVPQSTSESAWERGLKQARELLSRASKRKEEEVDFEDKRFNMTVGENTQLIESNQPPSSRIGNRERSPPKRRRHSNQQQQQQQHSSSEDEVERRHRLAYDAAPWNNQNHNSSSSNYQSGNYRSSGSRPNYSSNRSAETYRDPWRRSKSPKPLSAMVRINRKPEAGGGGGGSSSDNRYVGGEMMPKRGDRYNSNNNNNNSINAETRRSNSMSSLSSIDSNSSNISSPTGKSPGRKLPYARPDVDARSRYERENELPYRNDYPTTKSRMDRIPKKSNAPSHYQSNDRLSETKSFDSWSESLSESDSSSFYSNSDSSDESDVDNSVHNKQLAKKLSAEKRSQAKLLAKQEGKTARGGILARSAKQLTKVIDSKAPIGGSSKSARSLAEKEAKKPPIKMTFMKTQTSLKKDRLIDEQLNGEEPLLHPIELMEEDMEANNSLSPKFSSGKSVNSKSPSEDEDMKALTLPPRVHKDSSSSSSASSSTNNNKMHRREELLLKLKAVEEAIERKLNSKKD